MSETQRYQLRDQSGHEGKLPLNAKIDITPDGIFISFDGYGDFYSADGTGKPILIEVYDGQPRVVIWDDINEQDPKIISLENAQESKRVEE